MLPVSKVRKIAFVGDHLPRKCGIATFTSDLLAAVATAHPQSHCFAVSVNDIKGGYDYPEVVRFEIEEQDLSSYLRAADFLNISNVDVVCLQHEFGIFGGPAGGHILAFLRELRMPVVTTLHTVLLEPRADQRRVMQEVISLSTRLVVMAERGRQMLQDVYEAPAAKIDLIAHGIPDVGFVDPTYFKDQFGVEGKVVLLTFGLLSPNKGIEYVLNALPQIVAEFPEVVYIVLGATHPNELREHGEAYRVSLEMLAKKNKIEKNVIFYNDFVELENLKEFIGAADLYITPYLNEAQITSGTLAYTFGAGKAVVSTPYWHAAELLAEDRGVLVPFRDAEAIAREVVALLRDDTRRHAMRKNAYRIGRENTVEMVRDNPFDYVVIGESLNLPLWYREPLCAALAPYRNDVQVVESVKQYANSVAASAQRNTLSFLLALSQQIFHSCRQVIRPNGPPWHSDQTLSLQEGSCRDLAVLFCDVCRVMGIAARFVSGYECASANARDSYMHAWAEVYLPGIGWRGYDPARGLAVSNGHVAVAAGFDPDLASPVAGWYSGGSRSQMEASLSLQVDDAG